MMIILMLNKPGIIFLSITGELIVQHRRARSIFSHIPIMFKTYLHIYNFNNFILKYEKLYSALF